MNWIFKLKTTLRLVFVFSNGALGSLHLDFFQRPHKHRLEIVGTKGTIEWDYNKGETCVYRVDECEWKTYPNPTDFRRNDMFLSQMHHFLEVVRSKAMPLCTFEDGLKALQIALAAHASQEQRKAINL